MRGKMHDKKPVDVDIQATFPAKLDALHSMLEWIHETLVTFNASDEQQRNIELACEEALINIIHYSYPGVSGSVSLSCARKDSSLLVIIRDQGVPYNPLVAVPSSKLPRMGGYGILLMLHLMDQVDYRYIDGYNELTLKKR